MRRGVKTFQILSPVIFLSPLPGAQRGGAMARGVNRRTLIRYGALGTVASALTRPALATRSAAAPPDRPPAFALEEATVGDLQKRMESGQDSARTLCEKYIARI